MNKCGECGDQNCEEHFVEEVKKEEVVETPLIFSDKKFYYADPSKFVIKECIACLDRGWIKFFNADGDLETWAQGYSKEDLFENQPDAVARMAFMRRLYLETFRKKPFLKPKFLIENLEKFIFIESAINEQLKDYPNFESISFTDVSAGGIQIGGSHKLVERYYYGHHQPTIKYDFSNFQQCIEEFVSNWKKIDNAEYTQGYRQYLREGERYNWN